MIHFVFYFPRRRFENRMIYPLMTIDKNFKFDKIGKVRKNMTNYWNEIFPGSAKGSGGQQITLTDSLDY